MTEHKSKKPKAIANASPIICLSKAGLLDITGKMYSQILIPPQVADEIAPDSKHAGISIELLRFKWIEITPSFEIPPEIMEWNLGTGESAVISLALKYPADEVLIDDRAAARCARVYGLKIKGTLGILLDAKKQKIIPKVEPCLKKLIGAGLWISIDLQTKILEISGEH